MNEHATKYLWLQNFCVFSNVSLTPLFESHHLGLVGEFKLDFRPNSSSAFFSQRIDLDFPMRVRVIFWFGGV